MPLEAIRARFARPKRLVAAAICGLLFAAAWCLADTFVEDDNFRVVSSDLFRSGQLRSDEWTESYEAYRYRSVLNLRGPRPKQQWYRYELNFAAAHAVQHEDFELSARAPPSLARMEQLVRAMRDAPKPLLIHCEGGADRSGLAAALYAYAIEGAPPAEASRQLSLWFGHLPWLRTQTSAMDRALAQYLAVHGS